MDRSVRCAAEHEGGHRCIFQDGHDGPHETPMLELPGDLYDEKHIRYRWRTDE